MRLRLGNQPRSSRKRAAFVSLTVAIVGVAALLSGCSSGSQSTDGARAPIDQNPLTELMKPKITSIVKDGDVGVSPSVPITAEVADGKFASVKLLTPENTPVEGALAADGKSWQSSEPLGYNREYTLVAQAFGLGGSTNAELTFTTSVPDNLTKPYLNPGDSAVVGIAQPVAVQFDEIIPDRLAAQHAITVTTEPAVEGAFYWVNGREVRWRPENFWTPGTKVKVDVNVYGQDLGNGLYGSDDIHTEFTVGDAVVLTADDDTLQVVVTRNGEVVRTMPTSMGKPGDETPNGTYIIADRHEHIIMDSSTYGVPSDSPNGYKTEVDYATRMSYSGIFLHSAPWSVGQQGYSNTSHGCLNLSPENAIWVFNNTKMGDVAIVKNSSGGTLSGVDGLGDWNIPWPEWKAGNANAQ